jgi:hypothetical protein
MTGQTIEPTPPETRAEGEGRMMPLPRHGYLWTAEDDERLRSLADANVSLHLVAAKLNRSTEGSRGNTEDIIQAGTARTQGEEMNRSDAEGGD